MYKLSYPSWEHGTRLKWLMRNANLADAPKDFKLDDLGTKIKMDLLLDEVVYAQYLKQLEPEEFAKQKKAKIKAPEHW